MGVSLLLFEGPLSPEGRGPEVQQLSLHFGGEAPVHPRPLDPSNFTDPCTFTGRSRPASDARISHQVTCDTGSLLHFLNRETGLWLFTPGPPRTPSPGETEQKEPTTRHICRKEENGTASGVRTNLRFAFPRI